MTVKKALELLDWYIDRKIEKKNGLTDKNQSWNQGTTFITDLSDLLASEIDKDIEILQLLVKQLKPNCNHPKKWHDKDANGNLYCMGCNLDL